MFKRSGQEIVDPVLPVRGNGLAGGEENIDGAAELVGGGVGEVGVTEQLIAAAAPMPLSAPKVVPFALSQPSSTTV